jgi:hypothetical protein
MMRISPGINNGVTEKIHGVATSASSTLGVRMMMAKGIITAKKSRRRSDARIVPPTTCFGQRGILREL